MNRPRNLLLAALLATAPVHAATLVFGEREWRTDAAEARVESLNERQTLVVEGGTVWLDDTSFDDGVIELEVMVDEPALGFGGLAFRAADDDNFEEFYLRAHLSGRPDAVQYQPVINGVGSWQIHADANHTAPAELRYGEWMHLKAVVIGDRAEFFLDGELVLHAPDLKRDPATGRIGLRASALPFRYTAPTIRPLRAEDHLFGEPAAPAPAVGDAVIRKWYVSEAFPEAAVAGSPNLPASLSADTRWHPLDVESNGIANLARAARLGDEANTVLASLVIEADAPVTRMLEFGYSDRVRVYLNGRVLFAGDAGWRTRDYRYLGTVGRQDAVGLHLEAGRNEVVFAVSESFGGWAVTAALAERDGLTVEQPAARAGR